MKSLLPLLGLFCVSFAKLVRHDRTFRPDIVLEATEQNVDIACQTRFSVVFNGTSPGPTLRLREGKTSWIRVYNRIEGQNLTVHWHGLSQRTAPFSDGTPLIAQWPIPPNNFFDYEVRPVKGDAGTYFYHSHVGFQQASAHGALIVQDNKARPYSYDGDEVLLVGTYFSKTDDVIEQQLLANPVEWSGEADAVLINGKAGSAGFANGSSTCSPHIIEVEPGKQYRLRVVSASALPVVKAVIQGHSNLTVIEADGEYTQPASIDHIQVAPGQRFSYLLRTMSVAELQGLNTTDFWIRYETRDRPTLVAGYALLRYKVPDTAAVGFPQVLPTISPVQVPNITYDYLESTLESLERTHQRSFPSLSEVTRTIYINMSLALISGEWQGLRPAGEAVWKPNDFAWQEGRMAALNKVPYLINILKNRRQPNYRAALRNGGFDPASKTYPARVGEVLDIVWQADAGRGQLFDTHPMHMHGEHFYDLGSGNGTYDAAENEAERLRNGHVPARRDTTALYRYVNGESTEANVLMGWRAWRIRVTKQNVGAWMAHCHIAQHAILGMNTVWVFGSARELRNKFPSTPYVAGYMNYGGSAYGSRTKVPVVNHYFDDDGKA